MFFFSGHGTTHKVNTVIFQPGDTRNTAVHHENDDDPSTEHQEHTSPPVKKKAQVRSLFSLISRLLQI